MAAPLEPAAAGGPPLAENPFIYEINTWVWLGELSRRKGSTVDLASVPAREWDAIRELGFDAVWLMGVWERSPAGVQIALADGGLVESFRRALPDFEPADVVGSPYSVRNYSVDAHLGGPEALATARAELARRGLALILDFVPNHVAPDHPWTAAHPEYFVLGSDDDLERDSAAFIRIGDRVFAKGRDPNFPPWPDVVQLNVFSPDLRQAAVGTLTAIAEQCDGVRCDMAMLVMNDTFERTWGERAGPRPETDFWPTVIPAVTSVHPELVFIAEAYWDLEWALQQQGFDYCYDKRLYDRLVSDSAQDLDAHLAADPGYQKRLMRFIENHDEPRAAATFRDGRERPAAVAALTQTGARLVHEGQLDGRTVHLPVFLARRPDEQPDPELKAFYATLLAALRDGALREGEWQLGQASGWEGNDSWRNLAVWGWRSPTPRLVVVNLGDAVATGHVLIPWDDLRGQEWRLDDAITGENYVRYGGDLRDGMFVELAPWAAHIFTLTPLGPAEQTAV